MDNGANSFYVVVGLWGSSVAAIIFAVIYISRLIDTKLSTKDFDSELGDLASRVRQLELWAAKRNFSDPR